MSRWWVAAAVLMAACGQSVGASGGGTTLDPVPGDAGVLGADAGRTGGAGEPDGGSGVPDGGSTAADAGTGAGSDGGTRSDAGTEADGGSLACHTEPGPAASSCAELVPSSLGTLRSYQYGLDGLGSCGNPTPANSEGALVEVEGNLVDSFHRDVLNFLSPSGELVATVPQDAYAEAWPTVGGFAVQRSIRDYHNQFTSRVVWYSSSGQELENRLLGPSGESLRAFAVTPGGDRSAAVVTSVDGSSGVEIHLFDALGQPAAPVTVLPDSTDVSPAELPRIAFDSLGNLLVGMREVSREKFSSTPERYAGWWVGPDGSSSARFDLLGSRLDDAGVWLSAFVALPDGRLVVDDFDPSSSQHDWRWTVSRGDGVGLAPCWLAHRPDSRIQWIRRGRGYLVSSGSSATYEVDIVTSDGASCGPLDEVCPGCEGIWMSTRVGLDGTLSYSPDSYPPPSPCEVDWFRGAFR
jgi:hypothetical protein